MGKFKLRENVVVFLLDMNKTNSGKIIYSTKENKYEAFSIQNNKVNTEFSFNKKTYLVRQ